MSDAQEPAQPPPANNPAGRLHYFASSLSGKQGQAVHVVIGQIYGIDSNDSTLVMRYAAELGDLPRQIRLAIDETPAIPSAFKDALPEISNWLWSFIGSIGSGVQPPSESQVTVLKLCSELLSLNRPEASPSTSELDEIKAQLTGLLEGVIESSIDFGLQMFLSDQIHKMMHAIDVFRISGSPPSRAAVAEFAGELVLRSEQIKTMAPESVEKGFIDRAWTIAERIAVATALAPDAVALAHSALRALGS